MKNKTTKKNGLEFIGGALYNWVIYQNGEEKLRSQSFFKLDACESDIRKICQILYPHTVENQVVTEAVERFKKKYSKA